MRPHTRLAGNYQGSAPLGRSDDSNPGCSYCPDSHKAQLAERFTAGRYLLGGLLVVFAVRMPQPEHEDFNPQVAPISPAAAPTRISRARGQDALGAVPSS
jgi:hypothetical protein